ncbi:hypothetical protein EON68_03915 [archaeon]|nr:MAG: hypothetical protein EON68_03915 [archaeon]
MPAEPYPAAQLLRARGSSVGLPSGRMSAGSSASPVASTPSRDRSSSSIAAGIVNMTNMLPSMHASDAAPVVTGVVTMKDVDANFLGTRAWRKRWLVLDAGELTVYSDADAYERGEKPVGGQRLQISALRVLKDVDGADVTLVPKHGGGRARGRSGSRSATPPGTCANGGAEGSSSRAVSPSAAAADGRGASPTPAVPVVTNSSSNSNSSSSSTNCSSGLVATSASAATDEAGAPTTAGSVVPASRWQFVWESKADVNKWLAALAAHGASVPAPTPLLLPINSVPSAASPTHPPTPELSL